MPKRSVVYRRPPAADAAPDSALLRRFDAIRTEFEVPADFPPDVLAEAAVAATGWRRPDRDDSQVPFVTLDPPGSMDLDQAMCLERSGTGFRIRYAIADVPAFVALGGALDRDTRGRGETIYAPDRRTPLHPPQLSEAAASLLPGQPRPAHVWDFALDADGQETRVDLYRSIVVSSARLDYPGVQAQIDAGTAADAMILLREIGERRIDAERRRGGASLPMPSQEVIETAPGRFELRFRPPVPAEEWNAQLSLLTGMAAARIMLSGGMGLLRTMRAPDPQVLQAFRAEATSLGVPWPAELAYGEFLRGLDRGNPVHLSLIHEATRLFRGAGYTAFDGAPPAQPDHAAVAAPYAHVTAPLRRLADRFALTVCQQLVDGTPVPDEVRSALPALPELMRAGDHRAGGVERACTDAVEAAVLSGRIGQQLPATVLDMDGGDAVMVHIADPAIVARATGWAGRGDQVTVVVREANIETSTLRLELG